MKSLARTPRAAAGSKSSLPTTTNGAGPDSGAISALAGTDAGRVGIRVSNLQKAFGDGSARVAALQDVCLDVAPHEILALVGPSGCGKTTTLRCIAGLETPDSGHIEILGRSVVGGSVRSAIPPERRDIGMVFQSYALWPHMTVFANVAYPLRRRKVDRSTISQRVSEILALVGCENFAKRYPGQLSGGQQQRISLARALVAQPSIVLFDEPLSNLDAKLREQMRFDLLELHDRLKFTAVYVTHDRIEAMTVASRISVMRAGRVVQTGDARGVYAHPVDKEVADFMGAANFIPGRVLAVPGPGAAVVSTDLGELTVVTLESASLQTRQAVEICARPEQISLRPVRDASADRRTDQLWARCQVQSSTFQGGQWVHMVRIGKQVIRVDTQAGVKDSEFLMTGHDEVLLGLPQASLCAYGE